MIPKMTVNLGNIDHITKVSYPEVLPVKADGVVIGEAKIRKEDNSLVDLDQPFADFIEDKSK